MEKGQADRIRRLDSRFISLFGEKKRRYFSTPGRTEIGGNHTDHNHGRVLAASINLDSIAVAAPSGNSTVTLHSEGFNTPFVIDTGSTAVAGQEKGTTSALIRGVAAGLKEKGWKTGGFDACMTSDVLPGSGLSSSASVEVLFGTVFSALFNEGQIPPQEIAKTGQYAENRYFGKPCGLMDQMACAVGGIISIDFADPGKAVVKKVNFDFDQQNYRLLVVDTGGNHADLTADYAAVPEEMKAVAGLFNKRVCRELSLADIQSNFKRIREQLGDRAALRAYHFFHENERVLQQVEDLEAERFQSFLEKVNASGNSSFKWLQNVYATKNVKEQGITVALALTEDYIRRTGEGACRVHGGGFAGTILTFLPEQAVAGYIPYMEAVFGEACVNVLTIRQNGTRELDKTEIEDALHAT